MSDDLVTRRGFCRVCLKLSTIDTHYPDIYSLDRVYTKDYQVREFTIPCDYCQRRIYPKKGSD